MAAATVTASAVTTAAFFLYNTSYREDYCGKDYCTNNYIRNHSNTSLYFIKAL